MIFWYALVVVAVAAAAGVVCVVAGLLGRRPGDVTVGALALIEVLLVAQLVIAIVAPLAGNPPTGSLLEFWVYMVSVLIVPPVGVVWAFTDRTRWSTVVMGVAALSVAVMVWRMQVIWTVQGA